MKQKKLVVHVKIVLLSLTSCYVFERKRIKLFLIKYKTNMFKYRSSVVVFKIRDFLVFVVFGKSEILYKERQLFIYYFMCI